MRGARNISLAAAPLPAEKSPVKAAGEAPASKWDLLAAAMRDPKTFGKLKSAWWLFMRLVVSENGAMVASYDDMGVQLGVTRKTVENWARDLAEGGVITREKTGHGIRLALSAEYMPIVKAQDRVAPTATARSEDHDSPFMRKWRPVIEAAEKSGLAIEVKVRN